jgi:rfaE bifunctional protein kinase chain/domain
MEPGRLDALLTRFRALRVGVVGDFSLDRYFEIDPARTETSLETGLPVHNVVRVRSQPGAAGNIVQNLAALQPAAIWPVGVCGDDGEGFELRRALTGVAGVGLDHFRTTAERHTFTYMKPLVHARGRPPQELSRLDIKGWTALPPGLESVLIASLQALAPQIDALVVMDQSAAHAVGVVSRGVLAAIGAIAREFPRLVIVADSRHGLTGWPPFTLKMNAAEFALLTGCPDDPSGLFDRIPGGAADLAQRNGRPVFVTLAERGMIGTAPGERAVHVPALPVHGPIDVTGAGDAVTAQLALTLAAGATIREAMELAQAAASVVVHQLGTTGVATPDDLRRRLVS